MSKTTRIVAIVTMAVVVLGLAGIAAWRGGFDAEAMMDALRLLTTGVLGFIAGKAHNQ